MAAATLTATSVGITARVLSDLGRLHDPEGQIILGAAVIDDILGLLILRVVAELTEGKEVSLAGDRPDDGECARLSRRRSWSGKHGCTRALSLGRPDRATGHRDGPGADRRRWASPGWPIGAARR